MANEIKEIGDIVKKCKILLLDIEGTTTSISFVKDKLFPYAEENVQKFLESEWENEDVKEVVGALRKLALEDQENKLDGVVAIPAEDATKDEQILGLVTSVKWQMSSDRKVGALKQLQGLIWKKGYDNGDIKGHVYDDVPAALEQWRSPTGQKVYIYSSGSVQAQKLLFGQSLVGDLLPRIDGHFDTSVGAKQEATSYTAIAEKIGAKPEEILFLTDILKEAEAARSAGMEAALVSREGNAPLPEEAAASFPVVHSLAQLTATNKRKPDPQVEEETPAKVPKTDVEKDVKATTEPVTTAATKEANKQEQMEVETETTSATEKSSEPEKEAEKVVIEEITDSNEPIDAPMLDVEPVVEEERKTEENETEKAAKINNGEAGSEPKENVEVKSGDNTASNAENDSSSGPVIEDITNDKGALMDVADNADDLAPMIEEPPAAEDMEVLQNVGEVLEKECDEILSKVQDVTNLDSIPVKPLLNPIAEETMETENLDTNDIVERILDTEQELEMKQKEIMDGAAISEEKKTEEKNVVTQEKTEEMNGIDAKSTEVDEESNKKDVDSSSKEVSTVANAEENIAVDTQAVDKLEKETSVTESKVSPLEGVKDGSEEITKKITVEENPVTESLVEKSEQEKPVEASLPATEVKATEDNKLEEIKAIETSKPEENMSETQVNGKASNGDSVPNMNGDGANEKELCSRLTVENGKEAVNGSNGDSNEVEQGQGDNKVEEIADIKAKNVAAVEPPADPIDQPTQA